MWFQGRMTLLEGFFLKNIYRNMFSLGFRLYIKTKKDFNPTSLAAFVPREDLDIMLCITKSVNPL